MKCGHGMYIATGQKAEQLCLACRNEALERQLDEARAEIERLRMLDTSDRFLFRETAKRAAEASAANMRERAAKVAEQEAAEYRASSKRCDETGNTTGGSLDASGALASDRIAAAIRALDLDPNPDGAP